MLVLSRMKGETIVIGDNIRITVIQFKGDKVRLGIDAPGDVSVHREEIWLDIQAENREAAEKVEPIRRPFDSGTERLATFDVVEEPERFPFEWQ